jgi:dTDP-L-rhamnose 4-epimerase
MKVLVTGGLGFIGRALTRRLLDEGGHEIVLVDKLSEQVHGPDPDHSGIVDRPEVTAVIADICEPGVLRGALEGVEVVYHLAAETGTGQSMYEIESYYRTNVQGTAILLEEMVKDAARRPRALILASSRSIYGEGAYVPEGADADDAARLYPAARSARDMEAGRFDFEAGDGTPLVPVATREDDATDPRSLYAASKLAQEHMCRIACDTMGTRYTALRLQNVYGPGQSLRNPYTGILSIFTNILRQGGRIDVYEDGLESRDFVFVDDVARAFRAAADLGADAPREINVGFGKAWSVSEMVDLLERKMETGPRSDVSGRFRPGDIRHNWADIERMRTHLGFVPGIDLPEGLSRTVDWALTQPVEEDRSAKASAELKGFLKVG